MEEQLLPMLHEQNLPAELCQKFMTILTAGVGATDHLAKLSEDEKKLLENAAIKWQYTLMDKLREVEYLLMLLIDYSENDITFEYNHSVIKAYIDKYMVEHKRMPSLRKISVETGISRKTITQHMTEAGNKEEDRLNEYNFMAKDVLSAMLHKARVEGDTKAAKIYLDSMNKMRDRMAKVGAIHLDGFYLTQEEADKMDYKRKQMVIHIWCGSSTFMTEEEEKRIDERQKLQDPVNLPVSPAYGSFLKE